MKSLLKSLLLIAVFWCLLAPPATASDFPDFPFLNVQGSASRDVVPDEATLRLVVSAFAVDSGDATEIVQNQLVAVLQVLSRHSVPKKSITSYNLSKEIERAREDRVDLEIVGYYITRNVKVELDDISIFAVLVADLARIDNVSSLDASFDVSTREQIEVELMKEAGADARRIAENMVHGMSRSVGPVYAINESSFRSFSARYAMGYNRYPALSIAADHSAGRETIFEPSTIELRQTINVMFRLE